MTATETLIWLEAFASVIRRFNEHSSKYRYGVLVHDPVQGRSRFVYGESIKSAAQNARVVTESQQ